MRVLLTRPQGKGAALAQKLSSLVDFVAQQNVINIGSGPDMAEIAAKCQQLPDILIFISTNAVSFLRQGLVTANIDNDFLPSQCQLVAVGQTTANALKDWLNCQVITPQSENSEGVLALELMQNAVICDKQVVIVRGTGGREFLAEQLKLRGANVEYWQLYQRQGITGCGQSWWQQWQDWQIDTIVVTSIEIAQAIISALPVEAKWWWQQQRWICASARIANYIEHLGVNNNQIFNASGANDAALFKQIETIIEDHDV